MKYYTLFTVFSLLLCGAFVSATVIGIDFGSSFYKVVLVQRDFTLLLNEQSARKTKNVVAFREGNRYFGSQAENVGRLSPKESYLYVRNFLGKSLDAASENLKYVYYPEKVIEEQAAFKNGTLSDYKHLSIAINENEKLAIYELIAMIFNQAGKMAEKATGFPVLDCVITVPVYFTQAERQTIIQSASLAGLNVLSLINDNTAFALKYAIDRPLPADKEEETVLFYNHGESSLQLSLVHYQKTRNKKDVVVPQIRVISSAWSTSLGTREFDYRLGELFAEKINKKHNVHIQDNLRAMVKLGGELKKSREVLSANKESSFLIEGLTPDIDFGDKLTRDQFETMNEDLFSQIAPLLDSLLTEADMPKERIDSVEMVGGAVRIPKIQEVVKQYFGRETLDFHLNADEGAVFGAAFYAAGLSVHHKVKEMKLKDITPWKVSINITDSQEDSSLEIVQESDDDEELDKFATLFRSGNRYGARKTLSFYTNRPFKLDLKYDESEPLPKGTNPLIDSYFFDNLPTPEQYNFTGKPKVYLQFQLSSSGVIELLKAEAEITVTELIAKRKPVLKIPKEEETPKEDNEPAPDESATEQESSTESTETSEPTEPEQKSSDESSETSEQTPQEESNPPSDETTEGEPETEPAKEEVLEVVELEEVTNTKRVDLHVSSLNPYKIPTQIFKKSSRSLKEYDEKDRIRFATEDSKNELETYIYDVQEKLYDELVLQFSTEEERQTLSDTLSAASEWLYDNQNSKLEDYTSKKEELVAAADIIFNRIREHFYKLLEEQKAQEEAARQAEEAARKAEEDARKAEEAAQKAATEEGSTTNETPIVDEVPDEVPDETVPPAEDESSPKPDL